MSSFIVQTEILNPFYDRVQLDPDQAEVDEFGIVIYLHHQNSKPVHHPIVLTQFIMGCLLKFENTGDLTYLDLALLNARHLIKLRLDSQNAWWFQYDWNWTYDDRTLEAPWWSGMAQGEALTVFARLARIQPEEPLWRQAAEKTFLSFLRRGSGNMTPWVTVVENSFLWFEEYAGNQKPLLVMNGHVFAIFGIYDYFLLTGNEIAARYIDGGATTILNYLPKIRVPGDASYYCAQDNYCQRQLWQKEFYHSVHVQQLHALGRITGDKRFHDWAILFLSDCSKS